MIDLSRYTGICLLALTVIGWLSCTQQRQPCLTPKIATLSIETIHFPTDTSTTTVDTAIPAATFIPVVPGKDTQLVTTYPQQATFTPHLSITIQTSLWLLNLRLWVQLPKDLPRVHSEGLPPRFGGQR